MTNPFDLFSGSGPEICPSCHTTACRCPKAEDRTPRIHKQSEPIRIAYQRTHKGSGLTRIDRLPMNQAAMEDLLKRYRKRLGVGGSVKEGVLEIQGDHKSFVKSDLESLGYKVRF